MFLSLDSRSVTFNRQHTVIVRNMLTIIAALLVIVAAVTDGAAVVGTVGPAAVCVNSYGCGPGYCCRDASGTVLTTEEMGGFGPFGPLGGVHTNGTCSSAKAQKGEICDSNCQCDTGLACYRPMSGVCCPPQRCYDEAYVKQQQAYWSNCMSNPGCAVPP